MTKHIKLFAMALIGLIAASCEPDGKGNLPDVVRVPIPKITQAANSDVLIQDPTAFKGKFVVDLLFPEDAAPKQIDVVVTRNGDYAVSKVLKAAVTSFPTTVDVTTAQLATLFGLDVSKVVPGDYFEIGANIITQSGTYPAFSKVGNQFSADIANFPGSSLKIKYPVVCPLDLDDFVGKATAIDPLFMEYDYPVTITREGANVLVITGFVDDPTSVLKVTVNPQTTKVTVPSTLATSLIFGAYHNLKVVGTGEINACKGAVVLNLTYTVDEGSFGTLALTIQKD